MAVGQLQSLFAFKSESSQRHCHASTLQLALSGCVRECNLVAPQYTLSPKAFVTLWKRVRLSENAIEDTTDDIQLFCLPAFLASFTFHHSSFINTISLWKSCLYTSFAPRPLVLEKGPRPVKIIRSFFV